MYITAENINKLDFLGFQYLNDITLFENDLYDIVIEGDDIDAKFYIKHANMEHFIPLVGGYQYGDESGSYYRFRNLHSEYCNDDKEEDIIFIFLDPEWDNMFIKFNDFGFAFLTYSEDQKVDSVSYNDLDILIFKNGFKYFNSDDTFFYVITTTHKYTNKEVVLMGNELNNLEIAKLKSSYELKYIYSVYEDEFIFDKNMSTINDKTLVSLEDYKIDMLNLFKHNKNIIQAQ